MKDTWYDMGFDSDMSWMYDWKGKEKKMAISESKKKIVIENYFKRECDVNTSIKEAFTKGFELGLKKAPIPQQEIGHWIEGGYDDYKWVCSECGYPRYEYYEKPKAKYCECCGCPMEIEPQESEDKE